MVMVRHAIHNAVVGQHSQVIYIVFDELIRLIRIMLF